MTDAGIVTDRLTWQAVLAMAGFSQLWIVVLLLTILGCSEIMTGGMVSQLKCYSNTLGTEMKRCQEERGYTSCFTKYDPGGVVTGRGCSDKGSDDMFEEDCETFQSKEKTETYCYCPYYLCNNPVESSDSSKQVSTGTVWIVISLMLAGGNVIMRE